MAQTDPDTASRPGELRYLFESFGSDLPTGAENPPLGLTIHGRETATVGYLRDTWVRPPNLHDMLWGYGCSSRGDC